MKQLMQEALAYLQQDLKTNQQILVHPDDYKFFSGKKEEPAVKKNDVEAVKMMREVPPKPKPESLEEVKSLISKLAPSLKIKEAIPDDTAAKKITTLWKEELEHVSVILLSFDQTGENRQFLENVAAAISSLLTPAKVIDASRFEKEKKWALLFSSFEFKLVLAPEFKLWKESTLTTFYRENPTSNVRTLGNAPLLFLEQLSSYTSLPQLKKDLWKRIVSQLSS